MNKQEFKIYMEKCRVPHSLQPIIEQYQNCFGQNLREMGLIKTNPPSEFRQKIGMDNHTIQPHILKHPRNKRLLKNMFKSN